ncbi:MAG: glutaminyl-peptide cyclotransferase, partial [Candidatus Omnitrophica bacterium]|nr:glutaminyl-peptide cyclotransferase [Candidatus Omnitrophota bacterium]
DRIVKIAPQTGEVTGWINLEGILTGQNPIRPGCSLNGIAYDTEKNRIFVTGKYYPKVFEIEILSINGGVPATKSGYIVPPKKY